MEDPIKHLLYLFSLQTSTEQKGKQSQEHNKQGFNRFDAPILSSFANQWLQRKYLSEKQTEILVKRLQKYKKQIPPEDFSIGIFFQECLID